MHSLLKRQLKKYFKDPGAIPKEWEAFVQAVDEAYHQSDIDREMLERALDLSSQELMEANAGLREKEERMRTLVNAMPDLVCFKDGESRWLEINPRIVEIFHLQGKPYLGRRAAELSDLAPHHREAFFACEQTDELAWRAGVMIRGEEVIPGPDGKPLTFDIIKVPLFYPDGRRKGLVMIGRDITDRKQAEEVLKKQMHFNQTLIQASPAFFVAINTDGTIRMMNDAMLTALGYTPAEVVGRDYLATCVPEEDRPALAAVFKALTVAKQATRNENNIIARDGRRLLVEWHGRLVLGDQGDLDYFFGVGIDITERKRLEAQLFQAQKMEAIGTLAGGIAHDFNNLLMGIQGYVSLMLYHMDTVHPHYQKLKNIEEQVRSGSGLTRQLLGFARRGRYEPKPANLSAIVEKTGAMFGRTHKEMTIHTQYAPDLWAVEVDQGQIEQVLLNLLVNAWQAMPGGGHLYLETANVILDEKFTGVHNVEPGRYARLSVADTGVGMDAQTMERIFDPFFTTKEMGHGTGLGLASAYGIVKTHGGIITVESRLGLGSTFRIFLPASDKPIPVAAKPSEKILKGQGTILLVDDEQFVLDVNRKLIAMLGYEVLVAKNAREALDLYAREHETIDLILLDMIMPGMGGGETFDALQAINPAVRVILTSGYALDGKARAIMERGCRAFIQKPFTIQEISQKISAVLEPESPDSAE